MPVVEMEDAEFYPLPSGEKSRIVIGRFSCYTARDADRVVAANLVDKNVTIKQIIGEVAPLFSENFCRPHRGYLVNCQFISIVERYHISLMTGMIIPIPEKRHDEVREEIAAIMKRI